MDVTYIKKTLSSAHEELVSRISGNFADVRGIDQASTYISGLLSNAERKNGWQLAEAMGYQTPYSIQQFMYRGNWNEDDVRDDLREYVKVNLGTTEATLVIDETGFLKQGKKSAGVKRQYSGTAGRVENCQVGVFLTYAYPNGFAMIDRKLYLPEDWAEDKERRKGARIPDDVEL